MCGRKSRNRRLRWIRPWIRPCAEWRPGIRVARCLGHPVLPVAIPLAFRSRRLAGWRRKTSPALVPQLRGSCPPGRSLLLSGSNTAGAQPVRPALAARCARGEGPSAPRAPRRYWIPEGMRTRRGRVATAQAGRSAPRRCLARSRPGGGRAPSGSIFGARSCRPMSAPLRLGKAMSDIGQVFTG